MSRIKLGVVSVLAVFVVGALMASVASAEEFKLEAAKCENTGTTAFCWETAAEPGLKELKGTQTFSAALVAGTETLLLSIVGSSEVHIVCTSSTVTGGTLSQPEPLVKPPTALFSIKFTGCSLLAPLSETCKVPATLETEDVTGTFDSPEQMLFKPTTGEVFIGIIFTNNVGTCPLLGEQEVTGTAAGVWVTPETDAATHVLAALESEGELKFGKNAAKFLDEVTVTPAEPFKDLWDITKA